MSQNLPKRSLGDVLSLRHPNHFVLAGANNRNVIITYRFLAAPVQANRDFFFIDCMTVGFNYKYFPEYTRELLEGLLGISPFGRNPYGGRLCLNHTVQKGQPRSTRNEFPIRADITLRAEATFSRYELMSHTAKM